MTPELLFPQVNTSMELDGSMAMTSEYQLCIQYGNSQEC